jgi:hypothetical protein
MGRQEHGAHLDSRADQARLRSVIFLFSSLLPSCPAHSFSSTGALFGLFQTPLCALIALGSEDSVREHRREKHNSVIKEMEESPPALNTDMERVARPKSAHFSEGTYGRQVRR